ncbi:MAG: ribosome biogenesis/translation initiation ATPase RLI [Candidatus Nanoarchaeia archaeon]|nr:ribosome biogenesis/translation initiation ATPase RLI [Candidatus Nanoarchaeia archaeon]
MTRIAVVKKDKCNSAKCNWLCFNLCPINRTGKDCITKQDDKKPRIDEKLCTGCGICPNRCPYEAISIINLPEKLKQEPIIRFNYNTFELFSLPVPKHNKVIGILGRNGIGKSTALSLLSGLIKPNFGDFKSPPKDEEIIHKFSNSELGLYLKGLYDGKIKCSYKPQRIELLPQFYKGKVKDLVKKVDEKNLSELLLNQLELNHLLNRDISELSGGELQRLAILACLARNAHFYFIDEPASFLDVTQRIKVAKLIKELTKDSSVIVVEHDLATLDYISDEIQIVYGVPAVYGIFSQSKSTRRGINEYLDGYLPDDNIRFRDYKIKFSDAAISKDVQKEVDYEYPALDKEFKDFVLKVSPGKLHKGEVLAVMGANGLGKTTFIKMLAGLEKPSSSNKLEPIKVAYKPQYLHAVDGTVEEFLRKVAGSEYESGWYKQNILEKLGIHYILRNEIKNLSGGELQKVYVAATLSTDARIFALDEPSAFVDVEDRLKVAEVIKEFTIKKEVATIVVDHDVQFIDYLADSMLVFEGNPGKEGFVLSPLNKREGMNKVLKLLDITYRRDKENNRPRINKPGSQLDEQQREKGEYYYS